MQTLENLSLFRATYRKWKSDNASGMAAALAYYALFSIVPLLVLFISVAGFIFGRGVAEAQFVRAASIVIGPDVANFILALSGGRHSPKLFSAIFSATITLIGALIAFGQLQISLDRIWEIKTRPEKSFWRRIVPKTAHFILLLTIGLLFLGAAILTLLWGAVSRDLSLVPLGAWSVLWNTLLVFGGSTVLFGTIYRLLPRAHLRIKEVLSGAVLTAALFTLGNFLIGTYFRIHNPASAYGPAGAIIILLLWVYYSAQIFYFGAEMTYVYGQRKI